ncbi:MAG: orotidine-5'-phosphate decarboxylase [bacterium]
MNPSDSLVLSLDVATKEEVQEILSALWAEIKWVRIGTMLATSIGVPEAVRLAIRVFNKRVILDTAFHDTPRIVAQSVAIAAAMGAEYIVVAGASGRACIDAAAKRKGKSKILVSTVLSSFDEQECVEIYGRGIGMMVERFATMALANGADGIVCSAMELAMLNTVQPYAKLVKMVTGVRPFGTTKTSGGRSGTPTEAIRRGAGFIAIDTPILEAKDPAAMAQSILDEISEAQKSRGPK